VSSRIIDSQKNPDRKEKEMVTKSGAKKSGSKKGGSTKSHARKTGARKATSVPKTTAVTIGISALEAVTDAAHVEAQMTSSQCIVWRLGEFRARVRQAVANWAQEAGVSPSNTLSELAKGTPWNTGQMARLVQSVNATRVFEPPFPGTVMQAPSQLVPGSTTVLQWEAIVWRHQNPLTPCFPFTD
jgi:hypothetical protein